MATVLKKLNRGPLSTFAGNKGSSENTIAGNSKFPHTLSQEHFIAIKVYDTSKANQVNDGLAGAANSVIVVKQKAFGSKKDASGNDKSPDIIDSFSNLVTGTFTDMLPAGLEAFKRVYATGAERLKKRSLSNKALTKEWKDNLYLPLPNEISEAMTHNFAEKGGWSTDLAGESVFKTGIDFVTNASATISKMTGAQHLLYDENKLQMYEGSAFRSIDLSWTLVPNNSKESESLHDIIRKLKMYSSPKGYDGKLLLQAPHYFSLVFNNSILNEALQFDEVVLTNVAVVYAPGGSMELFNDNTPKTATISLTFVDREPKLQHHWEQKPENETPPDAQSCPV